MYKKHNLIFIIIFIFTTFCFTSAGSSESHFSLIKEFLKRETRGDFLRTSPWLQKSVLNPERIPGYDFAVLVNDYSLELIDTTENVALYKVTYSKLGDLLQNANGFYMRLKVEEVVRYYELSEIKGKWLIKSPIPASHIFPKFIQSKLSEEELIKIKQFLELPKQ